MEEKNAKLFLNSPNALPGNDIKKCDTSSAAYQSEHTGLVDMIGSEAEILGEIRELVTILPCNNEENASYDECLDDLNRVCAGIENAVEDTAIALATISDDNFFFETKRNYAQDMVTGFIRLNGMTVGAVANRSKVYNAEAEVVAEFDGSLSADGAAKAAEFVEYCDAFNIPVLSLTNVTGFKASVYEEKHLAKAAAKLTYAFANATVPKVNVIIGKAYGSAYVTMNSKSIGADMVYAWPSAEIGMMDAKLAAKIMYANTDAATINEKAAEYKELQSSPMAAARRGYVDTIIAPADTRKYVIGAFEMLFTKREDRPSKKHGTI
jgi:acetyl-CoA carboxylase carboxyltransferase component